MHTLYSNMCVYYYQTRGFLSLARSRLHAWLNAWMHLTQSSSNACGLFQYFGYWARTCFFNSISSSNGSPGLLPCPWGVHRTSTSIPKYTSRAKRTVRAPAFPSFAARSALPSTTTRTGSRSALLMLEDGRRLVGVGGVSMLRTRLGGSGGPDATGLVVGVNERLVEGVRAGTGGGGLLH